MIREIINFMKYLNEKSPMIFEMGQKPSKGLHIFVELDKKGNAKNFPGEKGKNWDYYDDKGENTDNKNYNDNNLSDFLKKILDYEKYIQRIGTSMNKVFDKEKQIFSCSPFAISFKKKSLENNKLKGKGFDKITSLFDFYFKKAVSECIDDDNNGKIDYGNNKISYDNDKIDYDNDKIDDNNGKIDYGNNKISYDNDKINLNSDKIYNNNELKQYINNFKAYLKKNLSKLEDLEIFQKMKKDFFINIYLKYPVEEYKKAHNKYLKKNLFNKNDFNIDVDHITYGLSGFFNGLNSKKPFLLHKTATMYKGIAQRIAAEDTIYLNDFDILLKRNIFPNPLPIFIDEKEFKTLDQIIRIFQENGKLSYSQIIKKLFDKNKNILLENYYLLFFNHKYEIKDFDFVSKFRYWLKDNNGNYPVIKNIYKIMEAGEEKKSIEINNIFHFESYIVRKIFNNFLVKIDDKKNTFSVKYFEEISPDYVSGGEPIYQMILKYRKAFYDYVYKSKLEAIDSNMWDEIMWNSIIADLKSDKIDTKGYHTKDYSIKEKLNIWFSLYNHFVNSYGRLDMPTKIPELLNKIREVSNDDSKHFESIEEFMFGAGQIIYFLFNQSRSSEKTHALLEPFIQKVNAEQLQSGISQLINTYKHELSFGHGRFERLASQVLAFETKENLKKYQRFLLAGYFATPVIYDKKENSIGGGENE